MRASDVLASSPDPLTRLGDRRGVIAAATVAGHAVAFAALHVAAIAPEASRQAVAMTVYSVADVPPQLPSGRVAFHFEPIAAEATIPTLPADMPGVSTDAGAAPGGTCDLTDVVQANLRADPELQAALDRLPRSDRSVASAVMLWDGHWIVGASPAARDTLTKIRAVVIATIEAASLPCRTSSQTGPRLMSLRGEPDTILALGSGKWRWADLASP